MRREHSLRRSLRRLRQASTANEHAQILSEHICHHWERNDPHRLELNDPDLTQQLRRALEQLESACYARKPGGAAPTRRELAGLLRKLHREVPR